MLYIMRHGRTDWNNLRKLQGKTDIPLNEEGRQMAREASVKCREIHLDVCYCSPLSRARETAQIVLENREVPIIPDERLEEMGFGIYEGVANAGRQPDSPMRVFFQQPENYIPGEGGETFEELFARTGAFLREMVYPKMDEGQDILIVGHGAMNASIICQVRKLSLEHYWDEGLQNCKLIPLIP